MILLNKTRLSFSVLLICLLSACTTMTSLKFKEESKNISKIYIIPTGKIEFSSIQGGGAASGAIPALLSHLLKQKLYESSIEQELELLQLATNRKELDKVFIKNIKQKLSLKYNAKFEELKILLPETPFNDWFNPDNKETSSIQKYEKDSLLIEFGYREISFVQDERCSTVLFSFDYSTCDIIRSAVGVRIVDTNTGQVVGRGLGFDYKNDIKIKTDRTKNMSKEDKINLYKDTLDKMMILKFNEVLEKAL